MMENNQNNDPHKKEPHKKEIDEVSGVETTGHEWDGLKELNNPLPRWWLWVFYATCIWSLWYFVVYPSWPIPGGATTGTSGYTQYKELAESQQEIIARQAAYLNEFENSDFDTILADERLYAFAKAGGAATFKDNCATCHGTGAAGGKGYPNLNDDDWIWGGTVEDIYTTLLHGIRVDNDFETRASLMPSFGKDGLLDRNQVADVVHYVFSLSGKHDTAGDDVSVEMQESIARGGVIFAENCASCHGADGKGDYEFGAPNLADAIWLYGGSYENVYESVFNARAGMMPAWKDRLDDNTIRQLAIYVHELGGGENSKTVSSEDEGMNE